MCPAGPSLKGDLDLIDGREVPPGGPQQLRGRARVRRREQQPRLAGLAELIDGREK